MATLRIHTVSRHAKSRSPDLGMSRTPVGEALQSLLREGYLEELLCRGLAAPRRTLDGLRQFFELREVLEAAASRYADLRALRSESDQFKVLCTRYEGEANLNTWNQMSLPRPAPPLPSQNSDAPTFARSVTRGAPGVENAQVRQRCAENQAITPQRGKHPGAAPRRKLALLFAFPFRLRPSTESRR